MISDLLSVHKGWALSGLVKAASLPRATHYFELRKAVAEYIDYYSNKRIKEKNKMDAPFKVQGSIHAYLVIQSSQQTFSA